MNRMNWIVTGIRGYQVLLVRVKADSKEAAESLGLAFFKKQHQYNGNVAAVKTSEIEEVSQKKEA